ncbi:TPA: hypothetical protein HA361_01100 [Candidatus Woesearchaeota archaeon]|nr:hypothetical protein [Candidatus Woesearchaeota archaeon]HII69307.1 hypothetical protein [Candidatus Woesearchaeota archaeon]
MADKKKSSSEKVVLERTYTVPLRKEFMKAPMYRRAKKAMTALREFVARHMKSADVRLGRYVNESVWVRGIKSPPHHVKVDCVKYEDGHVTAELSGAPKVELPVDKKVAKKLAKAKASKQKEGAKERTEKKAPSGADAAKAAGKTVVDAEISEKANELEERISAEGKPSVS